MLESPTAKGEEARVDSLHRQVPDHDVSKEGRFRSVSLSFSLPVSVGIGRKVVENRSVSPCRFTPEISPKFSFCNVLPQPPPASRAPTNIFPHPRRSRRTVRNAHW